MVTVCKAYKHGSRMFTCSPSATINAEEGTDKPRFFKAKGEDKTWRHRDNEILQLVIVCVDCQKPDSTDILTNKLLDLNLFMSGHKKKPARTEPGFKR